MKTVIFCGGIGTRLKEETEYKPKPMVLVGNRPIIWHIMKIYDYYGHKEFILPLGYKGDMIKDYFLNYKTRTDFTLDLKHKKIEYHEFEKIEDWKISFVDTGIKSLTAKRLKRCEDYLKDEDVFMATYGDGLANININDLLKFHKKMGKMCTITGLNPFSKYGVLDVSEGVVTKFREKPILKDLINGGFMVFNKEIFNFIKKDEDCMLEDTTLPKLAEKGEVALYKHEGFWHCMDTYKHFKQLNKMWAEKPEWKIW
ncbi:MAG: glucose-1-phosphate cytidylyltransferase [Candidatus Aenigmarchaeota archaeon]|nr:glucose-1-phosphate cytidylyltransferase [Candidatus Aenigmarchaeota archaeon]